MTVESNSPSKFSVIMKFLNYIYLPLSIIWLVCNAFGWLDGSVLENLYQSDSFFTKGMFDDTKLMGLGYIFFIGNLIMAIICLVSCIQFHNRSRKSTKLIIIGLSAIGVCEFVEIAMVFLIGTFLKEEVGVGLSDLQYTVPLIIAIIGYALGFAFKLFIEKNEDYFIN